MAQVLIAENDRVWKDLLSEILSEEHELVFWQQGTNGTGILEEKLFDVAIIDKGLNGSNGSKLLESIKKASPETVVIMTSEGEDAKEVVEAMRQGAFDFVVKPFSPEKIRKSIKQALENRSFKFEIDYLRRNQDVVYDLDRIIAKSPAMKQVIRMIERVAETDSTVLMTGETGTGKSFLGGSVHFNSNRAKSPFIKINCANMPDTLLDSEFFGHEKGAFTGATKRRIGRFEQGNGGTVFLDEIGEISPMLQAKLLRVLEEREFERVGGNKTIKVDVRIIAATNRALSEEIEKGRFREDLYYRINVLNIHLPPLRDRREDIELLAEYFLEKHCRNLRKQLNGFTEEVLDMFRNYEWPGNIRQLSNTMERAVLLADDSQVGVQNVALGTFPKPAKSSPAANPFSPEEMPSDKLRSLVDNERQLILDALEKNLWIQKDAAEDLGISRRVLNYKIKKLGITHPRWRKNV